MKESITKISITALLLIAMFGWLEKAQAGNSAGTLTRLSGKVAVLRRASQLMGDLNFERGSANLTPQAQSALSVLANELKAKPTSKIRVEGYTDDVGDFNFNKQLSLQRAETVKRFLIANGISANIIETEGYGELFPEVPNETDEDRAKNRRVIIYIAVEPKVGLEVYDGDVIQTAENSFVKVLMSDGTLVTVVESSEIKIVDYSSGNPHRSTRHANYQLVYGKGRTRVPKGRVAPDVRITTPTAVAGVRGTEIFFEYDPSTGQTRIVVGEGTVNVVDPSQPGKEITLTDGMATTIGQDLIPSPPEQLSEEELQRLRASFAGAPIAPRDSGFFLPPGSSDADIGGQQPPKIIQRILIEDDGIANSPEGLIDQEPPPFTPLIINIIMDSGGQVVGP